MVIKVLNLDKCIKKFEKINTVDMYPAVVQITRKIQTEAKKKAPYDSGLLYKSIRTRVLNKGGKGWALGIVFTKSEYAIYQEFGTTRPHFVPFVIGGDETGLRDWAIRHGIDVSNKEGLVVSGKPQPFLIPAYNEQKAWAQKSLQQYVKAELAKLGS